MWNVSVIRSLPCNLLWQFFIWGWTLFKGGICCHPGQKQTFKLLYVSRHFATSEWLFRSFLLPMTSQVACPPCLRKCQTSLDSSQGIRPTICSPFFMTKASKYCPTVSVMRFTCYSNNSHSYQTRWCLLHSALPVWQLFRGGHQSRGVFNCRNTTKMTFKTCINAAPQDRSLI